jgi:ABC-type polysaccharide/polyol phosphate export permease
MKARAGVVDQITDIWRYRELLRELFTTWLILRHTGSVLGFLWTLLNPLLMIATYWFVFSQIFRFGVPNFPMLLIPGYLAWNFTFGSVQAGGESIIQSKHLITKIAFPTEIIVAAHCAVQLVDFMVALLLYLIAVVLFAAPLSATVLWLPAILLLHVAFTLGAALVVACGAVYFKDIPKLVPVLGMVLFFVTPIFYTHDMVPGGLRSVIWLNPLTWIFSLYHDVLYYHVPPPVWLTAGVLAMAAAALGAGLLLFRKLKPSFAELS